MKKDWSQRVGDGVKNVVTRLIKNISIVAIFLVLAVVILTSLGAEFSVKGLLTSGFGVSSVLLTIGNLLLYELWLKNGQNNGKDEQEYKDCLNDFEGKSKNIHPDRMQNFIEYEKQRRYEVEEKKIQKEIELLDRKLSKGNLSKRARFYLLKRKQRLQDHAITVDMPYKVSEEFDALRYSIKDDKKKEYKPNDTRIYLRKQRASKYTTTTFFAVFSINLIVMGGLNGAWMEALFSFLVAVVTIVISITTGFSNGYTSITVSNFGVYKTANDFIDKAISWCTMNGFSLYYLDDEEKKKEIKFRDFVPYVIEEPEDYYRPSITEAFGKQEVIIE